MAELRAPRSRAGRRRTIVLVGAVVAALAPAQAVAAEPTIDVSAPQYESPGGTVPTIVTVYDVPPGYTAEIRAEGTNGAVATCVGEPWINRARATASRKCYLQLPTQEGSYNVRGSAELTKPDAPTIGASGTGSRAILGNGYVSSSPMPIERIQEIERCSNPSDHVWVTFDDSGSEAQVRSILATLQDNNVRGRFFFRGDWAASNPALMDRIVGDGHLLGNHTYSHPPLSKASAEEVASQIRRGVGATTSPKLLRPPFGAGALTTRLEALARDQGYALCRWTMDTYDWDEATAAQMAERVTHGDYRTPPIAAGGNILMHGGGRYTASGLQQIIDAVRAKGLALDPLRSAPDRTHTAAAISRYRHPDGAETVYLATARDFPDALAGGPAAARDDAPILLVHPDGIPPATAEELRRLAPTAVFVLGGTTAVSDQTAQEVRAMTGADVHRLAGDDRAGTAAAIARHSHPDGAGTVYVATGADFPDALAGGPAAAAVDDAPILLVAIDRVPRVTGDELDRLSPDRVVVLGGPSAVSDAVVRSIRERTDATVERIHGADRTATAAATARYSHPDGTEIVFVATGSNFPDAMAAGPAAAGDRAPILLVTADTVPQPTADEIERLAPAKIIVLGGAAAVSDATAQRLADISGAEVHRLWR